MLPKYLNIIIVFIALLVIGNVVLLDYFFVTQRNGLLDLQTRISSQSENIKNLGQRLYLPPSDNTTVNQVAPSTFGASCSQSCITLIKSSTASARPPTPLVAPIINNPAPATKGEFFIPLGTGTLTQTGTWTDMFSTQTTINTDNYPKIKAAYFEVSMHVVSGMAQARLYDSTTPAVFWNAVLQSTSTSGESLSAPINIYTGGNKTYRVQMYTSSATAFLDQARLHIITQ